MPGMRPHCKLASTSLRVVQKWERPVLSGMCGAGVGTPQPAPVGPDLGQQQPLQAQEAESSGGGGGFFGSWFGGGKKQEEPSGGGGGFAPEDAFAPPPTPQFR